MKMKGSYKSMQLSTGTSELVCDMKIKGSYKYIPDEWIQKNLYVIWKWRVVTSLPLRQSRLPALYVTREWRVVTRLNPLKSDVKILVCDMEVYK